VNANVRLLGIDAGALAAVVAKPVADSVLDAQRDEIKAFERAAQRRDVDADGIADVKL
jgi:hypothetical protein